MRIHLLLEGHLEEPVAKKLLGHCGHECGRIYGKQGFGYIKKKASGFLRLAPHEEGFFVLTDCRDSGYNCPVEARNAYLGEERDVVPPNYLLRFAVQELESWLLADRAAIAKFLYVPETEIPTSPESEVYPKKTMVALAKKSSDAKRRSAIVPTPRHSGAVAPEYLQTMTNFVNNHWRPEKAALCAPSLDRCIRNLRRMP